MSKINWNVAGAGGSSDLASSGKKKKQLTGSTVKSPNSTASAMHSSQGKITKNQMQLARRNSSTNFAASNKNS